MKNYRKLALGEVIREGDQWEIETAHDYVVPGVDTGKPRPPGAVVYRKARTGGCPPGWRWCDAGEDPPRLMLGNGVVGLIESEARAPTEHDSVDGEVGFLMPYPEDERLEE